MASKFARQRNPDACTGSGNQCPSALEVLRICHRAIIIAEVVLMPRLISALSGGFDGFRRLASGQQFVCLAAGDDGSCAVLDIETEPLSATHSFGSSLGQRALEAGSLNCSALTAFALLQGKWRVHILCAMRGAPMRLGRLSRLLPEASKKVLMRELKHLAASGLVERGDLSDDGGGIRQMKCTFIDSIRPATFLLFEQPELWALVWESIRRDGIEERWFTSR